MSRTFVFLALIGLLIAGGLGIPLLVGPSRQGKATANVTLLVSKDYGQDILGRWELDPSLKLTAMEMLKSVTDVETRYGGMFVYGMFGLESDASRRLDWFFYVNGVYMDRGLAAYRPRSGEVVQLDYHPWSGFSSSPGLLSGYPSKIIYGLGGKVGRTTIVAPQDLRQSARRLRNKLLSWGARNVTLLDESEAKEEDLGENVVILTFTRNTSLYERVQGWRKDAPWPSLYRKGRIILRDASGHEKGSLEDGCVVQCMDFPERGKWVLLVLATDRDWMDRGIERLGLGGPERYAAGFALSPSGLTKLPVR